MAQFDDHIRQACHNLSFFESVNTSLSGYYDWQVTVCFYTALHLINAHLAKAGIQYRKHTDVNHAINPSVQLSTTKIPEDEYVSYQALQSLSRKSRYLVNEKDLADSSAHLTHEKHLAKAIRHLDRLMQFFSKRYAIEFPQCTVRCAEIKTGELKILLKA